MYKVPLTKQTNKQTIKIYKVKTNTYETFLEYH